MPIHVTFLGASGALEFVNRATMAYYAKSLQELKGWETATFFHPDDQPHLIEVIRQAVATGLPYDRTHRKRRRDGALSERYPTRRDDRKTTSPHISGQHLRIEPRFH
jgi:hypothetical protein